MTKNSFRKEGLLIKFKKNTDGETYEASLKSLQLCPLASYLKTRFFKLHLDFEENSFDGIEFFDYLLYIREAYDQQLYIQESKMLLTLLTSV